VQLGWLGLPLLVALSAGCDMNLPGKPKERPEEPPEYVLDFDALYKRNCAGCHGANGTTGPAPPLNHDLFRAIVPEKALAEVISSGRKGTPMPAFARDQGGTLSAEQIKVLVYGIKGTRFRIESEGEDLARRRVVKDDEASSPSWGVPREAPEQAPKYQHEGTGSSGAAGRGMKVFESACAKCHGKDGKGGEKDQFAINDPAFLALISDQALRRIVITGRPDLGMPGYADAKAPGRPLKDEEIADVVALLASWRKGR
jgi:mono/diheme cytochrome c family protein